MNEINTIKPEPGTKIRLISDEYGLHKGLEGVVLESGEFEDCFGKPEFTVDFGLTDDERYLPIADKDVRWEVIA